MGSELIKVESVSKKFCRSLKRGLYYGFLDIISFKNTSTKLRKKEFWALKDVSFTLNKGEVLAIVGSNGAGKTSLIRILTKAYPVTNGVFSINGTIAAIFERNRALVKGYSGRENIRVKCALYGLSKKQTDEVIDEIIDLAEIRESVDAPFGTYSSGMKAKLSIATAIVVKPDIFIIDEAFATADANIRDKFISKILERKSEIGIILITHNEETIRQLASKVLVLESGKCVAYSSDIKETLDSYNDNYSTPNS